jgi:hypothetical protein
MYSLHLIEEVYYRLCLELEEKKMKLGWDIFAKGQPLWYSTISDVSMLAAKLIENFIGTIKSKHPCSQPDSLAAQVILNASINRAVLEIDELLRLHLNAYPQMEDIVYLLACALPERRIHAETDEAIYSLLQKVFTLDDDEKVAPEKWRTLTDEIKPLILEMNNHYFQLYCNGQLHGHMGEFRSIQLEPHNKFLMAVCLGWAYCTQEVHDLQIPGRTYPKIKILHKRSLADKSIPSSLLANLFRKYDLLFHSNQHKKRSIFELRDYSTAIRVKRLMLRQRFVQDLKNVSLAQLRAITDQLTAIKADYELQLSQAI